MSLSLLGVIAAGALGYGVYVSQNSTVAVPNIVGLTEDEAATTLDQYKLTGEQRNAITTTDCTLGKITTQEPTAGKEVDEGQRISYDLCTGPNKTKVPPMVGLSREQAEQALEDANLVGTFQEVDSSQEAGTVIEISPTSGTEIDEGSSVTVKISKGNQEEIPTVTGQTPDEARATLTANGFTNITEVMRTTTVASEAGVVVGQDPSSGKVVSTTTKITIYIGKLNTPTSAAASSATSVSPSPSTSS